MKYVHEQIAELIRIELLKRGFIVDVTCIPTKDNSLEVKTSSFQTTPVFLKNIWIGSWSVYLDKKENKNGKYIDYNISLSVFYEHFNGGRNSTHLFNIVLRMFEGWTEPRIISIN